MSKVRVSIDALRLNGFRPTEGRALAEGIKAELGRVLAGRAPFASARVPAIKLQTAAGLSPRQIGARAGAAIARGTRR